jgi:hypothetical protein
MIASNDLPYGWRDFDPDVVHGIVARDADYVVGGPNGGLRCPMVGHKHELLPWRDGDHRKGTQPHGRPAVRFHVSPTYVLADPLGNAIAGRDLFKQAMDGGWGKAETHRLGHENSEDALSWNVFRSLQEAERLHLLAPLLLDTAEGAGEPDLYLWGRRVVGSGSDPWARFDELRAVVEPGLRQQTEPDVVLHFPGVAWVFIEAKFGSRVTTAKSAQTLATWLKRYGPHARGFLDVDAGRGLPSSEFPEQILRNMVFADLIRKDGEAAVVALLARRKELSPVDEWLARCFVDDPSVAFARVTWEQIYRALAADDPPLQRLRIYLEQKSYGLRRALDV